MRDLLLQRIGDEVLAWFQRGGDPHDGEAVAALLTVWTQTDWKARAAASGPVVHVTSVHGALSIAGDAFVVWPTGAPRTRVHEFWLAVVALVDAGVELPTLNIGKGPDGMQVLDVALARTAPSAPEPAAARPHRWSLYPTGGLSDAWHWCMVATGGGRLDPVCGKVWGHASQAVLSRVGSDCREVDGGAAPTGPPDAMGYDVCPACLTVANPAPSPTAEEAAAAARAARMQAVRDGLAAGDGRLVPVADVLEFCRTEWGIDPAHPPFLAGATAPPPADTPALSLTDEQRVLLARLAEPGPIPGSWHADVPRDVAAALVGARLAECRTVTVRIGREVFVREAHWRATDAGHAALTGAPPASAPPAPAPLDCLAELEAVLAEVAKTTGATALSVFPSPGSPAVDLWAEYSDGRQAELIYQASMQELLGANIEWSWRAPGALLEAHLNVTDGAVLQRFAAGVREALRTWRPQVAPRSDAELAADAAAAGAAPEEP